MMNTLSDKFSKSSKFIEYSLSILCFLSNLSQLPIFIGINIIKQIIISLWILLFFFTFFSSFNKLAIRSKGLLIFTMFFDALMLILTISSGKNYLTSSIMYPLHLSIYIYYVAHLCGQLVDQKIIYKISTYYIYSALIVALYIYIDYFYGVNWANSTGYLYASKNSVSQIFLVAIILLFLFYRKSNLFKWGGVIFLSVILLMLKSRTTLLGFVISLLYIIFYTIKDKKKKMLAIFSLLVIILVIFTNESANNLIINNILLNNRSGANFSLDDISSGRLTHVNFFLNNFKNVIFIGTGGTYLESFPLAALMSYGILGSLPLFLFVLYPYVVSYRNRNDKSLNNWTHLVMLLNTIMLFNGLFEELSPLGPGVKNYILWLVLGLYTSNKKNTKYVA